MSSGHDHGTQNIRHEGPLRWALVLTGIFLAAEVVGALLTNSLALLSDAAHMSTDALALLIALISVRLSKRPANAQKTFGYVRVEALGASINGLMLFGVAGYILWEAVGRFRQPVEVASLPMLLIAVVGLVVNLVSMRLLKAGSGESLNVKGAYLEVWSDMLGSIAVILGALIIKLTGWTVVDPILAVLIGLWVLPRTFTLLKEALNVLMMAVPKGMDVEKVRAALFAVPGVRDLHDLHIWSLASREASLTVHLVREQGVSDLQLRSAVNEVLHDQFGIEHTTLQVEVEGAEEVCDATHR